MYSKQNHGEAFQKSGGAPRQEPYIALRCDKAYGTGRVDLVATSEEAGPGTVNRPLQTNRRVQRVHLLNGLLGVPLKLKMI